MPAPRFVHLRLHSEFSIQDGLMRLDTGKNHDCQPVDAARADGMSAVAVTDLANTFGLVKFYSAARKKGIKPIAGCDLWVAPPGAVDKPTRLLLLVQDRAGWHNLCELLSRAYRQNIQEFVVMG